MMICDELKLFHTRPKIFEDPPADNIDVESFSFLPSQEKGQFVSTEQGRKDP